MSYNPTLAPIGAIQDGITRFNNTNPANITKSAVTNPLRGFVPYFKGVAQSGDGNYTVTHANLSQPRVKSDFSADLMGGSPIFGEFVDVIA